MKLLSSDYDLTLNSFDYDLWINLRFIEKFRKKGNIFLLNTGRSYESIKSEINKYRINYDYLSCCDGNLILNRDHQIKHCTNLDKAIYNNLDKLQENYGNINITPIKYQDNVLEYEVRVGVNNLAFENELAIFCKKNKLSLKRFEKFELNKFKLKKVVYFYLCDERINKSTATSFVSELENIRKCDIFTIGDHHNDLEMVRDFNGYTLPWGKSEVKEVSNGQVLSVASLVKKISR